MKRLLSLILVLLLVFCPSALTKKSEASTDSYTPLAHELLQHSVTIQSLRNDGGWGLIGSGTLIKLEGVNYVLTAWHVGNHSFEHPTRICSVIASEQPCIIVAYPQYTDFDNASLTGDWAMFAITDLPPNTSPAPIRESDVAIGEEVYAFGSPYGMAGTITKGILSNRRHEGEMSLLMTDLFIYYGSSGGGLYDKKGRLIGITVAMVADGITLPEPFNMLEMGVPLPNMNLSVPVTRVLEYMEEY